MSRAKKKHDAHLLEAIAAWEAQGNTAEEFGELLHLAKRIPSENPTTQEETNAARRKLRLLPNGVEILQEELRRR